MNFSQAPSGAGKRHQLFDQRPEIDRYVPEVCTGRPHSCAGWSSLL